MPDPSSAASALPLPAPARRVRTALGTLLVLLIGLVVGFTYLRIERRLEATLEVQLDAVLGANTNAAQQWLREHEDFVRELAGESKVRTLAASLISVPAPERARHLTELLTHLQTLPQRPILLDVEVFDAEGHGLGWSSARRDLGPVELSRLRKEGAMVLVPGQGDPWFGAVAALALFREPSGQGGGFAVLIDAAELQRKVQLAHWGQSSQTTAFDAAGALVIPASPGLLVAAERSAQRRASQRLVARLDPHEPGVDVTGYENHHGLRVVGAWRWLENYQIGILTEVSRVDAYESVWELRAAFMLLSALVGLALFGFLALGRWSLRMRQNAELMTQRLSRLARTIQPLSAALENDPTAVLLVDEAGIVVYANASSHRVLRVSAPLVGHSVERAFSQLHSNLEAALDSGLDSLVTQGGEGEDETLLVSSRHLHIDGRPHFLYLLRPVTQQVRQQEIQHWRKLIRVLSHELNNSLAPITSLISSARKVNGMGAADPQLEKIFGVLTERTARLVAFLDGYRAIARLPRPLPVAVDWPAFVEGLACQVTFRMTGPLPSEPGFFDPVQLERVLLNLLKNAHEADGPESEVELVILDEGDAVRLEVQDRGTGMSEAVLRQAMLPFFSTKDTGTGVGLALAREVVEGHGGDLVLANREGGGLIVSLRLPSRPSVSSRGSLSRLRSHSEKFVETLTD